MSIWWALQSLQIAVKSSIPDSVSGKTDDMDNVDTECIVSEFKGMLYNEGSYNF